MITTEDGGPADVGLPLGRPREEVRNTEIEGFALLTFSLVPLSTKREREDLVFSLSIEQQDIVKAGWEFAEEEFPERAEDFYCEETFGHGHWKKDCESGFVGVFIPRNTIEPDMAFWNTTCSTGSSGA